MKVTFVDFPEGAPSTLRDIWNAEATIKHLSADDIKRYRGELLDIMQLLADKIEAVERGIKN